MTTHIMKVMNDGDKMLTVEAHFLDLIICNQVFGSVSFSFLFQ